MTEYGIITNIQKYTIHDGPGIRTEIFFKGCPLRCLWCSNPEGLETSPEPGFYPAKCLGMEKCSWCRRVCPNPPEGAHVSTLFTSDACRGCLKCADECPSRAIKLWGEKWTADELMRVILQDMDFYRRSGGGVTLSGGEVMLQWEFAVELLKKCHEKGIHTCVESALYCARGHMEAVWEFTDMVITDIKHMDCARHRECTGVGNELILENIRRTSELGKPLVIRTPVVPGYNADDENIRATGAFIRDGLGGNILQYQLLPYRRMGTEKYASLQRPYPLEGCAPPSREEWEPNLLRLAEMLRDEYGIPAAAGSNQKVI